MTGFWKIDVNFSDVGKTIWDLGGKERANNPGL